MAGPEEERQIYMKSLVMGSMVGNRNFNITQTLQQGYLRGNGMKLRSFYRWAENNYDQVGIPRDSFTGNREVNLLDIEASIGALVGSPVRVEWAETGGPDATYWAMQWMMENMPDRLDDDWEADFDITTDEEGNVTQLGVISFADGVTEPILFTAGGYEQFRLYVYAAYQQDLGRSLGPTIIGETIQLGADGAFPATDSWTAVSSNNTPSTVRLNRRVVSNSSYSDNRAPTQEVVENGETASFDQFIGIYTRVNPRGVDANGKSFSLREYLRLDQTFIAVPVETTETRTVNLDGGVVQTITDTITQDVLTRDRAYRIDTQEVVHNEWTATKLYIYRFGSGNTQLDNMLRNYNTGEGYYPLIPVRLNNQFISDNNKPALYEQAQKAYKKALGGDFDELKDKLSENESLGEIDFAYVVFGAALNTKENAAKKYIYSYFARAGRIRATTAGDQNAWSSQTYEPYAEKREEWGDWYAQQQAVNSEEPGTGSGGGGGGEPPRPGFLPPPSTSVHIVSNKNDINYNIEIDWGSITETRGIGLALPGMKRGQVEIVGGAVTSGEFWHLFRNLAEQLDGGETKIYWQLTEDSWKCLTITNLVHKNLIWNGKSVEITASEALGDDEETGFIIPMHADVFREMSLVDATQMSTACAYLVLNCYQIVKKKWYQRGWFKVVLFIAVVVITVITMGAGAGAAAGVLGTNMAVGTALGLAGTAAVIAGAIANAIAAMIITRLITAGAVALFGDKFGQIIGAIVSYFTLSIGAALQSGQTMASMWSTFMRADNLLRLTSVLGNGVASLVAADVQGYAQKTQEALKDYEEQSKEIERLYAENIGYATPWFDPTSLTEAAQNFTETEDMFLSRTLMTGTEIAELSMDMIGNFADLTLRTDMRP